MKVQTLATWAVIQLLEFIIFLLFLAIIWRSIEIDLEIESLIPIFCQVSVSETLNIYKFANIVRIKFHGNRFIYIETCTKESSVFF